MMKRVLRLALTLVIAVAGACAPAGKDVAEAVVAVVTTTIPADGQCAHITLTRLADFQVTEYRGPLASATLRTGSGDQRVAATAYPAPCATPPPYAPWVADPQQLSLVRGQNSVTLKFRPNTRVDIGAEFDDELPGGITVVDGSRIRIGRNSEDLAAGGYALDGYEVKSIAVPPSAASESVLFSTQSALAQTPRGLAVLADGRLAMQNTDPWNVHLFSASGTFLGSLPVSFANATMPQAEFTDGLDPVDATHLVRTASSNSFHPCPVDENGCLTWLEILELKTAGGAEYAEVVQQIFLPDAGLALHQMYALGVTAAGGKFFVTVLETNTLSHLVALYPDGSLAAGPVPVTGSVEGLSVDAANRLITMDYAGNLRTFSTTDLTQDVAASLDYRLGVDLSNPQVAAFRSATSQFIVYNLERLALASADLTSASTLPIDLSGFGFVSGFDYLPGTDALAVIDRFAPYDTATGLSIPSVVHFDLGSGAELGSVVLAPGVSGRLRPRTLAYLPATDQYALHYRRPANAPDVTVDPVVFLHHSDGSLASSFSLAPYGFTVVQGVNAALGGDELIVRALDSAGVSRLVVTTLAGVPLRAFPVDVAPTANDLAVITTGSYAGQVGFFDREPSFFVRAYMP